MYILMDTKRSKVLASRKTELDVLLMFSSMPLLSISLDTHGLLLISHPADELDTIDIKALEAGLWKEYEVICGHKDRTFSTYICDLYESVTGKKSSSLFDVEDSAFWEVLSSQLVSIEDVSNITGIKKPNVYQLLSRDKMPKSLYPHGKTLVFWRPKIELWASERH